MLFLVRSLLIFGHKTAFWALPCPKFTHLRTQNRFLGSSLSEVYSSSDTKPPFVLFLVRSLLIFGHKTAFWALPCPKFTHLRTQNRFLGSSLSEVYSSSDTKPPFGLFLVRSLLIFGHKTAFWALPCPKFPTDMSGSSTMIPGEGISIFLSSR